MTCCRGCPDGSVAPPAELCSRCVRALLVDTLVAALLEHGVHAAPSRMLLAHGVVPVYSRTDEDVVLDGDLVRVHGALATFIGVSPVGVIWCVDDVDGADHGRRVSRYRARLADIEARWRHARAQGLLTPKRRKHAQAR